ncbi:hypothetical protein DEM27_12445 [Metarhizobium album]|uniref:Uncharacterized protein n=1 Tax=Metarhizobium album TaxID=2182425 RepID=A0A2U2DSP4_9HYPH|nr:hypothetical protein [Rhizobium album]PWE56229.1 hypothetical protein DEM27_12445 [Rhizobium album]
MSYRIHLPSGVSWTEKTAEAAEETARRFAYEAPGETILIEQVTVYATVTMPERVAPVVTYAAAEALPVGPPGRSF